MSDDELKSLLKVFNFCPMMCYYHGMRQKFDVGDLVEVKYQNPGARGIVIETEPINKNVSYPERTPWHTDEYKCKVKFITTSEVKWVRAKWLSHLSKINE